MRYTVASLALAALATAKPMPGGVTSAVAPAGSAPAGCQSSYSGSFEIEVVNASTSSKRSVINKVSRAHGDGFSSSKSETNGGGGGGGSAILPWS